MAAVKASLLLLLWQCCNIADAVELRGAHARSDETVLQMTRSSSVCKTESESPPGCPPRTYTSKTKRGFCYDPAANRMISTYYDADKDWCSKESKGKKGGADYQTMSGIYVWVRQAGKVSGCCNETAEPTSCPRPEEPRVNCPVGTYQSKTTPGYCYYAEKDQMISTYFLKDFDWCASENSGKTGAAPAFNLTGIPVWFRSAGREPNCCLDDPVPTPCPTQSQTRSPCPPGTYASKNTLGYCYHATANMMVSTYFVESQDWCSQLNKGNHSAGNGHFKIAGTVVWKRQGGKDGDCCEAAPVPKACPVAADARIPCPEGTFAAKNETGLCYFPGHNQMVATYFDPARDWCAAENRGKTGAGGSYKIGTTNVWFRQSGKLADCCHASPVPKQCPRPTDDRIACPPGTFASKATKGYCYDATKNQMVSTYFLEQYDWCPSELKGKQGAAVPYKIGDVNVWVRLNGMERGCCNVRAVVDQCPIETTKPSIPCPAGTYPHKNKTGYCYYSAQNKMISTYMVPATDWCTFREFGKIGGKANFKVGNVTVWERAFGMEKDCCENQTASHPCPEPNEVFPDCPVGTFAHRVIKGYCYYPATESMVSTYFLKKYDFCGAQQIGSGSKDSFKINGVNVWTRKQGKEKNCCNSKPQLEPCPNQTALLDDCPAGTYRSKAVKGLCYHPKIGMISTYFLKDQDWCPNGGKGIPNGGLPHWVAGVQVWRRSGKKIEGCCEEKPVPDLCPKARDAPQCPPSSYPTSLKGYCYIEKKNQMVSTWYEPYQDWCGTGFKGNRSGADGFKFHGQYVWTRSPGKDPKITIATKAIFNPCPLKDDPRIPCPIGTYPAKMLNLSRVVNTVTVYYNSTNHTGYCYDPTTNAMISTYHDPEAGDWCGVTNFNSRAGVGDSWKIGGVNVWKRQSGQETNCCEANLVEDPCPSKNQTTNRPCPAGTFSSKTVKGYCYDGANDRMVSTFWIHKYDECPGLIKGRKTGNLPINMSGHYVWIRSNGMDMRQKMGCCAETWVKDTCNTNPTAVKCPPGTNAHHTQPGICYDPAKGWMVSTYAKLNEDYCPDKKLGKFNSWTTENHAYKISNTSVWLRSKGRDGEDCCSKAVVPNPCPTINQTRIPCPKGTFASNETTKVGLCYHVYKNWTVSTYHIPDQDWCNDKDFGDDQAKVNVTKDGFLVGGVRVWFRQLGKINTTNFTKKSPIVCLEKRDTLPAIPCPEGTYASRKVPGLCYDSDADQMVSTWYNPKTDYCATQQTGNVKGRSSRKLNGVEVWTRRQGLQPGCCYPFKVLNPCPLPTDTRIPCPPSTLPSNITTGYCFDPVSNYMVSTYMLPETDWCRPKLMGKLGGNNPWMVKGLHVWKRRYGEEPGCCTKPGDY
eukprot:TRINITY_DN7679_c0_g3_i1.p1 TRINITY_DN7679_c0_g3~~TRINITY_DN7679_c0_g3_i1.p1  ORF type:complete len:1370 (-),score=249.42 TRINITY_DN7679_c0_g3_i1:219-4328(-)